MNIIDSLAKEIKYKLPKLTDYFGKSICSIRNISIIDNEVYIETTDKHNLFNNQKIFIKNVSIPCKITSINGKIITINNYHHLISNLTNSVSILNEKNPKYNGDNIPLELDIDGKTLKLNIDGVDDYIDNEPQGYLILNHDQIVNGFREIEVINDTKIKLKDYKLKDYIDVKAYIKNANITIGQRVFGCLDLDDAINEYSLNFLNENNKITNKEREDLTCYICLEPKIVSEHADGYSGGLMNYNLLLYVFIPIFNKNKNVT